MSIYSIRQNKLQERLKERGIDGMVVTQNVSIYYLTGSMQNGLLVLPAEGEAVYYVRRSVARAKEESCSRVEEQGSLRTLGERALPLVRGRSGPGGRPVLAADLDVLPVQTFRRLEEAFGDAVWKDGSALLREQRMVKGEEELDRIRAAARVAEEAFEKALTWLEPGLTDVEWMTEIEAEIRRRGHIGLMRMRSYNQELITGMVGSGAEMAVPTYFDGPAGGRGLTAASPQGAGRKRIARDEPILVDIGCCIDGYVIDQTRTVVIGELPERLFAAYEASERILAACEAMLRPGTVCEDIYARATELAVNEGLSAHFMGYGADQVRFIGHGIGLEIDEWPVLAKGFRQPLEPGMVLAVEPKFTFPGLGVVGIENSYAIREDGFEKLTLTREGLIRLP
ncbi:peptidase M24 [Paenibacillus sp. J31TS4]|uniref:M24 family metallopeptidase n=1 Tax=Paenibacillus sp. J31TS4 TaxID=2807195 RepID=UPI001B2D30D3|nr:Xaa-Pro peptidase family protein [Paenibacillus sp. J31TS4]GIP41141.1 peptidase M24 [Paenibacillus sp. J31TS4]